MNIFQKINVIFSFKPYRYSKIADKIINEFIKYGIYYKHDDTYVTIIYNDIFYKIWIWDYYSCGLKSVEVANEYKDYIVYSCERPSRKTMIKFWKWVENYIGDVSKPLSPRAVEILSNIKENEIYERKKSDFYNKK